VYALFLMRLRTAILRWLLSMVNGLLVFPGPVKTKKMPGYYRIEDQTNVLFSALFGVRFRYAGCSLAAQVHSG
jgi:hypothetical protein